MAIGAKAPIASVFICHMSNTFLFWCHFAYNVHDRYPIQVFAYLLNQRVSTHMSCRHYQHNSNPLHVRLIHLQLMLSPYLTKLLYHANETSLAFS